MSGARAAATPSERRVAAVGWEALAGLGPALEAPLAEVLAGAAGERVLDRTLRALRPADAAARAAVAEAVFGVGLWRRRLRHATGEGAPPRLLLAALLRDLGGRPASEAEALAGIAAGALPAARPAPEGLADRFSLPDWLAAELAAAAGPDAAALADALCAPGPVTFRANRLRLDRAALAARLAAEGVRTRPGALAPDALVAEGRPGVLGLEAARAGLLEVQDEGSQLLGLAAGARPGETVLDACAGAGGKTLLLAACVGPGGRVLAADPDAGRLERLAVRARAAGADAIVTVLGPAAPGGLLADRVLVDAPCSELGALRRGPDLRWRLDPGAFEALPALQGEILARAAHHVRPGGRLVYATCTFRRAENEQVALAFEAAHPAFARVRPEAPPQVLGPNRFLRTWPHEHGTDGFFAAAWELKP